MESMISIAEKIAKESHSAKVVETLTIIHLRDFAIELARVCKNIRDTSIGEDDRLTRCRRLSEETGIHYLTIRDLC